MMWRPSYAARAVAFDRPLRTASGLHPPGRSVQGAAHHNLLLLLDRARLAGDLPAAADVLATLVREARSLPMTAFEALVSLYEGVAAAARDDDAAAAAGLARDDARALSGALARAIQLLMDAEAAKERQLHFARAWLPCLLRLGRAEAALDTAARLLLRAPFSHDACVHYLAGVAALLLAKQRARIGDATRVRVVGSLLPAVSAAPYDLRLLAHDDDNEEGEEEGDDDDDDRYADGGGGGGARSSSSLRARPPTAADAAAAHAVASLGRGTSSSRGGLAGSKRRRADRQPAADDDSEEGRAGAHEADSSISGGGDDGDDDNDSGGGGGASFEALLFGGRPAATAAAAAVDAVRDGGSGSRRPRTGAEPKRAKAPSAGASPALASDTDSGPREGRGGGARRAGATKGAAAAPVLDSDHRDDDDDDSSSSTATSAAAPAEPPPASSDARRSSRRATPSAVALASAATLAVVGGRQVSAALGVPSMRHRMAGAAGGRGGSSGGGGGDPRDTAAATSSSAPAAPRGWHVTLELAPSGVHARGSPEALLQEAEARFGGALRLVTGAAPGAAGARAAAAAVPPIPQLALHASSALWLMGRQAQALAVCRAVWRAQLACDPAALTAASPGWAPLGASDLGAARAMLRVLGAAPTAGAAPSSDGGGGGGGEGDDEDDVDYDVAHGGVWGDQLRVCVATRGDGALPLRLVPGSHPDLAAYVARPLLPSPGLLATLRHACALYAAWQWLRPRDVAPPAAAAAAAAALDGDPPPPPSQPLLLQQPEALLRCLERRLEALQQRARAAASAPRGPGRRPHGDRVAGARDGEQQQPAVAAALAMRQPAPQSSEEHRFLALLLRRVDGGHA